MALNFRLFNCDRTFNLDSVEALIRKVTTKLSRETKIEKSYFPLPRMSELCKELEEGGSHFDYAVFVVHAHESRLSINEKNAGIGYAKLYLVLQKVSDDRVLVVIGGDDNYKDEGERDKSVLSRWAWHKICSQFTEGYLNGAKSFIFSWEDSHNPIHEEALEFYLDPKKKGQEFVARPKPPPPVRVEPKKVEDPKGQESVLHPKPPPPTRVDPKKVEQPKYDTSHEKKQDLQTIGNMGDPLNAKQMQESQAIGSAGTDKCLQQKTALETQFPKEMNANRPMPSVGAARKITTDKAGPLQDESSVKASVPTYQAPRGDEASDLHIISFHSSKESVDVVERLLQEVSKHQTIPSKPFISHSTSPDMLSRYITTYKPRYLILVSDMEFFKDLPNLDNQVKLYQDLVKNSQDVGTKLIFVIREDVTYEEGDVTSSEVQSIFTRLNEGIPKTDKLTIMSWNKKRSPIHIDVLAQLLSSSRDERAESLQYGARKPDPGPEYDSQDRRLRYSASISYGSLVNVLKSDPPEWKPDNLYNLLDEYKGEKDVLIEYWEEGNGKIVKEVQICSSEARLFKISEGTGTDGKPSVQVYCYYSKEETVKTMNNFIHWLGVPNLLEPQATELQPMIADIVLRKPDYVVLSADIEVFQDLDEVKVVMQKNKSSLDRVERYIGKRIILMLLGDTSYKNGEMASEKVKVVVDELTKGILNRGKLMVMSWETRPYTTHQEWMKKHLIPTATKGSNKPQHSVSQGAASDEHSLQRYDQKTQEIYDHKKGYLRYKAVIYYGGALEVLYRNPPDWEPDATIMEKLINQHKNEDRAFLQFWETEDGKFSSLVEVESKGFIETAKDVCFFWRKKDKKHSGKGE